MERLVLQRKPIRQSFTLTYKALLDAVGLNDANLDLEKIDVYLSKLIRLGSELELLDSKIIELVLDLKDEPKLEKEYEEQEEYKDKLLQVRVKVDRIKSNLVANSVASSRHSSPTSVKRKLKLPKLELKQFGGEIKDWLSFWSQFKRIHEDKDMEPEDKFQYLIQGTIKGSKARDIVESFPPTAENYTQAIDVLKNRYGRDELLIEHYVRELINLVIKNTTTPKAKINISTLYDKLESHLRALESIGMTRDKYEAMLFPLVESCIPEDILRAWLRNPNSFRNNSLTGEEGNYSNRLQQLLLFIKGEVESEERISMARVGFKNNQKLDGLDSKNKSDKYEYVPTASSLHTAEKQRRGDNFRKEPVDTNTNMSCVFCEKCHESKDCFNAQRMTSLQKKDILAKKRACFLCLKVGHRSKDCKSNVRCILCSRKHQTIVCPDLKNSNENGNRTQTKVHCNIKDENPPTEDQNVNSSNSLTTSGEIQQTNQVFLQTLMVKLCNGNKKKLVRALLDSGSQRSYIKKSIAEEMGYTPDGQEEIVHTLFGGIKSNKTEHKKYQITVFDKKGLFSCNMNVLDQPVICSPLPRMRYGPWCKEMKLKNIFFTDIGTDEPEIELLIGADMWSKIMTGATEKLDSGVLAMETCLGWTIMGILDPTHMINKPSTYSSMVTSMFVHTESLPDLWNLDVLGITDPYESKTKEDRELAARKHFENTVTINNEGRYEIALAWVEPQERLGSNKIIAEKRLLTTTQKLKDIGKFSTYDNVFLEWEKQGIIEEVKRDEKLSKEYFLPHRAVIKEESTTKVRPVFDASNKKKGNYSLNDCLEKGPNVIELIPVILLRFREKKIGVVSDIEKAFLQISVNKHDREYLKFLWWKDYEEKIMKVYKHCRVVFGINCSPYMLGAVINHHLGNCSPEFQDIALKLKDSFYVDNCVTSVESESELSEFIERSTKLMSSAQFNLRDWQSTLSSESEKIHKPCSVLGLLWDRCEDKLYCDLQHIEIPERVTRRIMLSIAQKVFDPIGFTSPFTILPKLLLQETWKSKVDWDVEVEVDTKNKFLKWCDDLKHLNKLKIPRCIGMTKNNMMGNTSLHVFCDASKSAYAVVVFLRTDSNGVANLHFLMAKSRVSPLKAMTIPRLELMACLIGTRIMETIKRGLTFNLENVPIFYWTDSSTALFWIMKDEPWGQFIQNRVKEIRDKAGKNWFHVPGEMNPADLPSRGCHMKTLIESKWWEGPAWLKGTEESWPKSSFCFDPEEINPEKRKTVEVLSNFKCENDQWYLNYFSNYIKIVRMVAWMKRFIKHARNPTVGRESGELLVSEIQEAEIVLIKQVQKESFDNFNCIQLKSLCCFVDSLGIVRIKTKLTYRAEECNNFKFPIVLPSNHSLVLLLIAHEHILLSHSGLNILLSKLRERFWIIKGRSTVRSVLNKCIVCRRHSARRIETEPASLPSDRVEDTKVFEKVGVDLAGPLIIKGGFKVWITVFTCAVYRAVHFELISSLSADGFILGLRRFIARRGRPKIVYSDNGTNFIGTNNLFKMIDWSYIERHSSSCWRIQWKFNPPTAAWWGGWWERIVQMVKGILKRVLRRASVKYEEMCSILCDAEAVINSRPLTYLSDEMDEMIPLTPNMFLQENPCIDVIDLDLVDGNNFSRRFKYQQQLREDLRKRFRNEYLGSLVIHDKNSKHYFKLKEGDIVLIGSEGKKRMDWPLGKIIQLYPGKDNVVRVARVKTMFGELLRPVQRLYPMEVTNQEDSRTLKSGIEKNNKEKENVVQDQINDNPQDHELNQELNNEEVKTSRSGRKVTLPPKFHDFEL